MDADTQGLASALALLGIYNVADLVGMARCGALHEVILTAVEQHKLEQRVAEAKIVQSSVAVRRAAQLAQAVARATEAERRQAEAEAKSGECRSRGSWASQAFPSNPHLSTEYTLAYGARSHTDTSPIPRSGLCRHTGSFVAGSSAGSSSRRNTAAAAASTARRTRSREST